MHLLTDDAVYSCGSALERSVERCGTVGERLVRTARLLPFWGRIRERGYRSVADRRAIWGRVRSCEHVEGAVSEADAR